MLPHSCATLGASIQFNIYIPIKNSRQHKIATKYMLIKGVMSAKLLGSLKQIIETQ